ncbi:tetratricopeptide repeat protein [Streptomyces fagopyri]|uniref:hypothetical protein n=1 Tax=Streptomyces fagopyri TaxID=2662397 RepID=UPI0037FF9842
MNAADLDYQARTLAGCIPPQLVTRLLELGHEQEVERQAGHGEWFCAREWARLLGGRGRHAQALEVLAPYVATGWWTAVQARAEMLRGWGRGEEAIELCRPYAQAGDRLALVFFARLLAEYGQGAEAFTLLRDGIEDWFLAEALVDVAEAAGLDEEAAAMLVTRIEAAAPACGDPDCTNLRMEPWNAIDLLAAIRERQGRIEEAIALLRRRSTTSVNNRDALADLLARHDRIDELREYAASEHHGHAVQRLAEVLEARGDVEGAVAVYRAFAAEGDGLWHVAVPLTRLLVRDSRGDEAIEVMRMLASRPGGAEDWIVDALCTLYSDLGRAREGLAYLDALKAGRGVEDWDFFQVRLLLLAACGLLDEGIEEARAHPEGDTWYAARCVSKRLAEGGRLVEAMAVLEAHPNSDQPLRAEHLIELGRIKDAVRILQQWTPTPATHGWSSTASTEPPF